MKKILVVKGQSAYNVLRCATDEICKGFEDCGYWVDTIDSQEKEAAQKLMDCLERRNEYAFYFSMQAIGWEREQTNLPQLQEMKRIGWIVDDPIFHGGRLVGSTGKDAHIFTIQDSFTNRIREEFPYFESVNTLFHGGFTSKKKFSWEDKDIDVFFSGSYSTERDAANKVLEIDGAFGVIAKEVMKRIYANKKRKAWNEEVRDYLQELAFEIDEGEFHALLQVLYPLDHYQRTLTRNEMIKSLLRNGIRVSVVGKGWDKYDGEGKENLNILSQTGVDISEVVELMQRSKFVLHNINFDTGMHERIFTAMLAGAICVTSEYATLNRFFESGKEVVTYPKDQPEQLPILINELLENPEKAKAIANAGYQAAQKHSWQKRGEQIVKWMEDGLPFEY